MVTGVEAISGQELWESAVEGTVHVKRLDHRGEFVKDEIIQGGGLLHITPEERELNQERVRAGEQHDPFLNGFLIPKRLVDGHPGNERLKANPNVIDEASILAMLKATPKTLLARLEQITNQRTLERVLEAAIREDVTIKRAEAIRSRIAGLREAEVLTEDEPAPDERRARSRV